MSKQRQDNVSGYTNYFRQIAIKHKDLLHDVNSETGNGSSGSCRFSRWNVTEVVTGIKATLGATCLLLELYETVLKAESVIDIKGDYSGAFSVVCQAQKNNANDEERAFGLAETIVYEILNQIYKDHYGEEADRCTSPFQDFMFDNLDIIPFGPVLNNHFGWRCSFQFTLRKKKKINGQIEPGTFLP